MHQLASLAFILITCLLNGVWCENVKQHAAIEVAATEEKHHWFYTVKILDHVIPVEKNEYHMVQLSDKSELSQVIQQMYAATIFQTNVANLCRFLLATPAAKEMETVHKALLAVYNLFAHHRISADSVVPILVKLKDVTGTRQQLIVVLKELLNVVPPEIYNDVSFLLKNIRKAEFWSRFHTGETFHLPELTDHISEEQLTAMKKKLKPKIFNAEIALYLGNLIDALFSSIHNADALSSRAILQLAILQLPCNTISPEIAVLKRKLADVILSIEEQTWATILTRMKTVSLHNPFKWLTEILSYIAKMPKMSNVEKTTILQYIRYIPQTINEAYFPPFTYPPLNPFLLETSMDVSMQAQPEQPGNPISADWPEVPYTPYVPAESLRPGSPYLPYLPGLPDQTTSARQPSQPEQTLQPGTPISPKRPSKPMSPQLPGGPEETVSPSLPGQPTSPVKPGSPISPGGPNKPHSPNSPYSPSFPGQPKLPHTPGSPLSPTRPDKPYSSDSPHSPNVPEQPNLPHKPGSPLSPSSPDKPHSPNSPGLPKQPNLPKEPGSPLSPNRPDKPDSPVSPGLPAQPNTPYKPESPLSPSGPNKPFSPSSPDLPKQPNLPNKPLSPNKPNRPHSPDTPLSPKAPGKPKVPHKPKAPFSPVSPDKPHSPDLPGKPTVPFKPKAPLSPSSPEKPISPDSPKLPGKPTAPDVPLSPSSPDTPISPTSPDSPRHPSLPDKPSAPLSPSSPDMPVSPTSPHLPKKPNLPGKPSVPFSPNSPDMPVSPTSPDLPRQPTAPSSPSNPTSPDLPGQPTQPDKPSVPLSPSSPAAPNLPENPLVPLSPSNPALPYLPKQPTAADKPGAPFLPGSPDMPGHPDSPQLPKETNVPFLPAGPDRAVYMGRVSLPASPKDPKMPVYPGKALQPSSPYFPKHPGSQHGVYLPNFPTQTNVPKETFEPETPSAANIPEMPIFPGGVFWPVSPESAFRPNFPSGPHEGHSPSFPGQPEIPNEILSPEYLSSPNTPTGPMSPERGSQPLSPELTYAPYSYDFPNSPYEVYSPISKLGSSFSPNIPTSPVFPGKVSQPVSLELSYKPSSGGPYEVESTYFPAEQSFFSSSMGLMSPGTGSVSEEQRLEPGSLLAPSIPYGPMSPGGEFQATLADVQHTTYPPNFPSNPYEVTVTSASHQKNLANEDIHPGVQILQNSMYDSNEVVHTNGPNEDQVVQNVADQFTALNSFSQNDLAFNSPEMFNAGSATSDEEHAVSHNLFAGAGLSEDHSHLSTEISSGSQLFPHKADNMAVKHLSNAVDTATSPEVIFSPVMSTTVMRKPMQRPMYSRVVFKANQEMGSSASSNIPHGSYFNGPVSQLSENPQFSLDSGIDNNTAEAFSAKVQHRPYNTNRFVYAGNNAAGSYATEGSRNIAWNELGDKTTTFLNKHPMNILAHGIHPLRFYGNTLIRKHIPLETKDSTAFGGSAVAFGKHIKIIRPEFSVNSKYSEVPVKAEEIPEAPYVYSRYAKLGNSNWEGSADAYLSAGSTSWKRKHGFEQGLKSGAAMRTSSPSYEDEDSAPSPYDFFQPYRLIPPCNVESYSCKSMVSIRSLLKSDIVRNLTEQLPRNFFRTRKSLLRLQLSPKFDLAAIYRFPESAFQPVSLELSYKPSSYESPNRVTSFSRTASFLSPSMESMSPGTRSHLLSEKQPLETESPLASNVPPSCLKLSPGREFEVEPHITKEVELMRLDFILHRSLSQIQLDSGISDCNRLYLLLKRLVYYIVKLYGL